MRVSKFFILALLCAMCSCSENEIMEPTVQNQSYIQSRSQNYLDENAQEVAIDEFFQSLDSLNAVYADSVCVNSRSLGGEIGKKAAVIAADEVGKRAGAFAGKWVGSTLCAGSGNPVVVAFGYYGGRAMGSLLGASIASALTKYALDRNGLELSSPQKINMDADFSLKPSFAHEQLALSLESSYYQDPVYYDVPVEHSTQLDSIGYYHNLIMCEVDKNIDTLLTDGLVDVKKLYRFIAEYLVIEKRMLPLDFLWKDDLIDGFIDLGCSAAYISITGVNEGFSLGKILSTQRTMLTSKYRLNYQTECPRYVELNGPVIDQCSQMKSAQIKSYAKDLNNTVLNSKMSMEHKEYVLSCYQMIVNSSLCWTQE